MKLAAALAFTVSIGLFSPVACAQGDLAAAALEYEESLGRGSLYRKALGIEAFAATKDPRAFKVLVRRYAKPEVPQLHTRYLLAAAFEAALQDDAGKSVDVLAKLLPKHKKPVDAWLHRCVYGLQAKNDAMALRFLVNERRTKPHLRAAAILALGSAKDPQLLQAIPGILGEKVLPKKGQQRAFVIEACARALGEYRELGREALAPAAEALIAQFGSKAMTERDELVLGRLLQRALKASRPGLGADGWRAILNGKPEAAPGEGETRVRASFFSVQGTGRNVAYVLDLSDSMLEPLGEAETEKLRQAMPDVAKSGAFARNRFEVTKLMLARSLKGLSPGMSFAIVAFGSVAELVTPGMLTVTPANVKKALAALEGITVGDPEKDRPHGTLKGWTNLYGGLRLAFKVKKKGAQDADDEYVDKACFTEGCDTIFLLSDGEPTWSDFEGWDQALPGDVVGDGEGGGGSTAADGEEIQYYGPHFLPRFLYADLRRMNLFRNVQIHSIGIGEADPKLLAKVSEIGMGSAHFFGAE
jgi:hypothetical protein